MPTHLAAADSGAVTLTQRFGSAANLDIRLDEARFLALAEELAPELTPSADQRVPSSHIAHLDRMLGWIRATPARSAGSSAH